jgi:hypothetical protein
MPNLLIKRFKACFFCFSDGHQPDWPSEQGGEENEKVFYSFVMLKIYNAMAVPLLALIFFKYIST